MMTPQEAERVRKLLEDARPIDQGPCTREKPAPFGQRGLFTHPESYRLKGTVRKRCPHCGYILLHG